MDLGFQPSGLEPKMVSCLENILFQMEILDRNGHFCRDSYCSSLFF